MATTSLQPGAVVNGRYVLRRSLASSEGSALFEAEDTSLQRPVALRVLLYDVLASEEWREYLKHETTAVAALHHPNLTRIYDWGEEAGNIYVVSEYLPGGSLRDVLAARGRLSQEQTALIGLEAATALAYAHARGFVHGALRPSKILFDAEGRVRVGDLGMSAVLHSEPGTARALEEARYCCPEQVLGVPLDGRSDVYSLALILFECLTGHVPHSGRTLETIRTNRLGAPLPQRPELGPLDLILALGAAHEPAARPDAVLFASRLASVATTLPVPRPVTLAPGNLGGFVVPTPDDVLSAPAIAISGRASGESDELVRPFDLPGYRESVAAARVGAAGRPGRGGRAAALLAAVVVILLAVGLGVGWKAGWFTPSYAVPSLEGLSVPAAHDLLGKDGLNLVELAPEHSSSVAAGDIISQRPAAGASLKQGQAVRVVPSSGAATLAVPAVLGQGCKSATTKLVAAGFSASCPIGQQVTSATVAAGAVVAVLAGTTENPASEPAGTALVLVLSKGPAATSGSTTTTTAPAHAAVAVPNLVGKDPAQAKALMHAAGLYYETVGPGSNNATWTTVVSSSPGAGTRVPWHSSVTVTVTNS
jgi:serine/threonine-protein kinase